MSKAKASTPGIAPKGARITAARGDEPIDKRNSRYLDVAIGADRYARVVPSYRACLARRRPTYAISMVQDADGKDVSYERLLLPFRSTDRVEQIVGSFKASRSASSTPSSISLFVPRRAADGAPGDLIELS